MKLRERSRNWIERRRRGRHHRHFVFRMGVGGQGLFSTYFNVISGRAVDSAGMAYVVGNGSPAITSGVFQAYIAKVDPTPGPISLDAVVNPAIASSSYTNQQGAGRAK